jgi:Uncharacterised nucleotidyltransferase
LPGNAPRGAAVIGGSWRPTAAQELLLEATVGDTVAAAAAFQRWRGEQDLATLDDGSARLLPLLVPRSSLFPASDPAWPVIRGCYRRAYFHGQMLRARAAEAMAMLADSGIPALALKGGALLRYYDGNPALRPMNDFDALVPRARALDAIRLLIAHGWRSTLPNPELLPDAYHSACFTSRDGLDFDLHWDVVPSSTNAFAEDDVWTAAVTSEVGGMSLRAVGAEDLLTVVCAHAAQWSPIASIRWVADALAILRSDGTPFDWARVVRQSARWNVVPHLHETLSYLHARWHAPVPATVLAELAGLPVSAVDRRAYAVLGRMPGTADYLARPWHRYRLRSRESGALQALPGFVGYLKVTLGRARASELPAEILARFRLWRRDRALGRR